jgi:lysozyme family protein
MKHLFTILFLFLWTASNEGVLSNEQLPTTKSLPAKQKASFLIAYKIIQEHEGGYANIANDFGEETYRGISRKFAGDWQGWPHIDQYKQKNGTPKWNFYFNDITDWHVTDYYVGIWVREGFCDLVSQPMANYLFDFRIHSSLMAIKIIQQQLNEYNYQFELDNKMNPEMIAALNNANTPVFLKVLREKRIDLYKRVVDRHPSQKKFLSHWLKRAKV